MKFPQDKPVLIVGGGIGGLSTGVALARHGIASEILEQSEVFTEVGAGIQLGPNATRILNRLGFADSLYDYVAEPEAIQIVNGHSGNQLNSIVLMRSAVQMFGTPYLTIHRADLQKMLLDRLASTNMTSLRNSFKAEITEQHDDGSVSVSDSSGNTGTGSMLVGADGIWSATRDALHPDMKPVYSGKTAWRALVDIEHAPLSLRKSVVLYLGTRCHLVHYPVRKGKLLNIVAVISDRQEPNRQWDRTGHSDELQAAFRHWNPGTREFLSSIDSWTKWALYEHSCPGRWVSGHIALLGDAVHPTLPFLAQGAVMALEDADCLAQCLTDEDKDISLALKKYQKLRVPRVSRVQKTSRNLGYIYHLGGPFAMARNLAISAQSPRSMLESYSWLYGFKG